MKCEEFLKSDFEHADALLPSQEADVICSTLREAEKPSLRAELHPSQTFEGSRGQGRISGRCLWGIIDIKRDFLRVLRGDTLD